MLTSLFSLFYVTGEFRRFLHGGRAFSLACVAADSFPFSGGAEIEQANEKRASEGTRAWGEPKNWGEVGRG